jgi:hypothetical protein
MVSTFQHQHHHHHHDSGTTTTTTAPAAAAEAEVAGRSSSRNCCVCFYLFVSYLVFCFACFVEFGFVEFVWGFIFPSVVGWHGLPIGC